MSEDCTVASGFISKAGGLYPSQAVCRQLTNRPGPRNFYTRIRVIPNDERDSRPPYEIWGHYDLTRDEALADFHDRNRALVLEHRN